MCFFKVGFRPTSGMLRVRVIEAHDLLIALAGLPLDADELTRVDDVTIMRRVGPLIGASYSCLHDFGSIFLEVAE